MELTTVRIEKPEPVNFILGQSHFIKTIEDVHETLVGSVPGIKFGLAFCESSGPALVRAGGTDSELVALAKKNALALSAGHSFIILLGEGFYPVNVLNAVKAVPEVCRVYCATANPNSPRSSQKSTLAWSTEGWQATNSSEIASTTLNSTILFTILAPFLVWFAWWGTVPHGCSTR